MDLNSIQQDRSRVEDGAWVKDIPEMGDLELKVRGLSCELAINVRDKAQRRIPRKAKNADGSIKESRVVNEILIEVMVDALLLDWKNVTINGKVVPYSKEKALEILSNEDYRAFRDAVATASQNVDEGFVDDKEDAAKN